VIPITCHAGEAGGSQEVYYAIKFGAKRIGHGIKICKDKKIMKSVKDIKKHPVRKFYNYGIKIIHNNRRSISIKY
jgi:adenosine deaminase